MRSRPLRPVSSDEVSNTAMVSLGWPAPSERLTKASLKSRYRIITPLAKIARSGLVLMPLNKTVAPCLALTSFASLIAILLGPAVNPPNQARPARLCTNVVRELDRDLARPRREPAERAAERIENGALREPYNI